MGELVPRGWFFECGRTNGAIKLAVAGGADFLHCWVTDSIWLECAGLLITKQYL